MASNKKPGTSNERSAASVVKSHVTSNRVSSSNVRYDTEHGSEEAAMGGKDQPTSPDKVSLQDANGEVDNEESADVTHDADDTMASNSEVSEESQQQESPQDSQDSMDKDRIHECEDTDVSEGPANPPPSSSDVRRHLAEQDATVLSSGATTPRDSGGAAPRGLAPSFPQPAARPSSPPESHAPRVEEQRHDSQSSAKQQGHSRVQKRSDVLPQKVRKTTVHQLPEPTGRIEPNCIVESRPATTTWRHPAPKKHGRATVSNTTQTGIDASGTRTPSFPSQPKEQSYQCNLETSGVPRKETKGAVSVSNSRWHVHSAATPPLSKQGQESRDRHDIFVGQNPAKDGSVYLPTRNSSERSSPSIVSRDSGKGASGPGFRDERSLTKPVSRTASSKLRPSPTPSRQSKSPDQSSLSEKSTEGSVTHPTAAAVPDRSLRQLKQPTFNPPWMMKRQRRDSALMPMSFAPSSGQSSPLLATSTMSRYKLHHAGELPSGAIRGEAFGNPQSMSNFMSSTTQGFFADRGVKAFCKSQPTTLVLCALLVLLVAIALLVLLGAFGGHLLNKRRTSAALCRTEPCREYSRRLLASMNTSVNPCEGFTHFVCDGWRRHNRLSVRETAFLSELRRMSYHLRSVPVPRKAQKPIQRAAAFYRSCDAVRRGDVDELSKVKSALLQAGIMWPRLPKVSDSVNLLGTLLHVSLKLRWNAVLHVSIEHELNATVITLAPLRQFERIVEKHRKMRDNIPAAKTYFEILSRLGALGERTFSLLHGAAYSNTFFSKSTYLRRRDFGGLTVLTAGDTVTFADNVKLESTFMVPLSRALSHSRDSGGVETIDLFGSVPELSKELWITELGRYASVPRPLVFRTKKPGYVGALLELWKVRGEREMHLFFSWSIVQTAALYANRRLLVNFYGCEDCADLYDGAFCLSKAYLLAGNQLFQEYFDELFSQRAMNSARRVVSDTFDAFALQLDAWPYRDANLTAVKDSKADRDLVLGYFNPHSGRDKRKHTEAAVFNPGDLDDSLVGNWQLIAPRMADVRHRWAAAEQIEFVEWTVLLPDHVVAVLPHALSFPSFDESATRFMNQGGLGNHVALALSKSFFRSYADSSDAAVSAFQFRECTTNATHFGDSSSAVGRSSVAMPTLALEASLNAYHAGTPTHSHENLEGFEAYNATAMFFVASCYALCGGHDGVLHFTGYECDEAFRNVSGFAGAFACEPGS